MSTKLLQDARRSAKRKRAAVACFSCKEKKAKCSGYRPCSRCADSAACIFPTQNKFRHPESSPFNLRDGQASDHISNKHATTTLQPLPNMMMQSFRCHQDQQAEAVPLPGCLAAAGLGEASYHPHGETGWSSHLQLLHNNASPKTFGFATHHSGTEAALTYPTSSWTPVSEVTCRFSRSMHQTKQIIIDKIAMFDRQAGLERTHFVAEADAVFVQTPSLPGGPGATQASSEDNIVPAAHTLYTDAAAFTFSSVDPAVLFNGDTSVMWGLRSHAMESRGGPPAHEAPNRFDGGGGGEDDCGNGSRDWACPPRAWLDGSGGEGSQPWASGCTGRASFPAAGFTPPPWAP